MRDFAITVDASGPASQSRRRVLGTLLVAYSATQLPWVYAEPSAPADLTAFNSVSSFLIGSDVHDSPRSARLFEALVVDSPGFAADVQALSQWLHAHPIAAEQLQGALDAEKSVLAPLPRKIASAWYLGIVGTGKTARCIDFETALNAQIVAGVLKPPTYCYGGYGSWMAKPV
ncbi:MAG TPA: sugar dehydrogenase complex small subunit [Rudaea sp.]|nr:sugar dehydrogenase complex small subunit [Rudaea sp.]